MRPSSTKFLDTPEAILREVQVLSSETNDWLAVDAERASGFRYRQRAYLLQLGFSTGEIWLLDPLAFDSDRGGEALDALRTSLPKNWILHSSTQDFPCLFELDLRPKQVFDTELGAKVLGLPRVGLASLLSELLDLTLLKEHSASDWSVRPLTDSMLAYAAADVEHLHALKARLEVELVSSDRLAWANQEFQHLLGFTAKPADESKWKRLPGLQKTRDQQALRIAKALWIAREDFAREIDMSPGRVIPDRSIVAVAISRPISKSMLASTQEFKGRFSRSKLDLWWHAIQNSDSVELDPPQRDQDYVPNHRTWERKHPDAHERYLRVRPRISEIADMLKIAPEILVAPDVIRTLCFNPPEDLGRLESRLVELNVRPWQRELIVKELTQALSQGD